MTVKCCSALKIELPKAGNVDCNVDYVERVEVVTYSSGKLLIDMPGVEVHSSAAFDITFEIPLSKNLDKIKQIEIDLYDSMFTSIPVDAVAYGNRQLLYVTSMSYYENRLVVVGKLK
jgi:hypothetical protein